MEHGCSGFSDEVFIRATELRGCEEINMEHGCSGFNDEAFIRATDCEDARR